MSDKLRMDGFNDCIIGKLEGFDTAEVYIYDRSKVIQKMTKDDMSEQDAWEWYRYNMLGSGLKGAPMFLVELDEDEL